MSQHVDPSEIAHFVKDLALKSGFDRCGITPAVHLGPESGILKSWVEQGYNGEMSYLSNNFEKRCNPSKIVEGAKSVVVVALNYFPEREVIAPGKPHISKYARGLDYHGVIKRKLSGIMAAIVESYPSVGGRIFTDTAPLLEKPLAVRAGLGWQGKNSLIIVKDIGSYLFLGELVLDVEMEYDKIFATDHCGNCSRCISACPTGAINSNRTIDARKCISYLTVESREGIPEDSASLPGENLFGCDICQDVCPWNIDHKATTTEAFLPLKYNSLNWDEWAAIDADSLSQMISGSSLERVGATTLINNSKLLAQYYSEK